MISCSFENGHKTSLRHTVVDNIVIKNGQILLVKRIKEHLEGEKWGLVGGFVERDENLKEAVEREIFEETGYKVCDITLLGINDDPNRPHEDRQNIAFVFFCEALEKEGQPDKESTEQKWFSFDSLPPVEEIAFDHYKNIQNYLKYTKGEIQIPLL